MQCREQSGRIAQAGYCLIYPPRTADKLYVYEFFEEKLGVELHTDMQFNPID